MKACLSDSKVHVPGILTINIDKVLELIIINPPLLIDHLMFSEKILIGIFICLVNHLVQELISQE